MAVQFAGATRLSLVVPLAAAVTITLFILMQVLIRTELIRIEPAAERPRIVIAEYVDPVTPDRRPPEIPEPVEPPEYPRLTVQVANPGAVETGAPVGPIRIGDPVIEPVDAGAVVFQPDPGPVVRVEPTYPPRLLERGIEGRCMVRFDVLGSGRTANVQLLDCDRGFEEASLRAVREWRYSATDRAAGEPRLRGLTTVLDYRLD